MHVNNSALRAPAWWKQALTGIPGLLWTWRLVRYRIPRFLGLLSPGEGQPIPLPVSRPSDRGPPPIVDRAALAARYRRSSLSREPDTFVLYRIVGNDLPPRHASGQSLENLRFILEHEPVLPGCEKRFVVNRIVDPEQESAILALLDRSGLPYLHLPFDPEVYRELAWDDEGVPAEYAPWTERFATLTSGHQGRALVRLYRHKNNYAMNNNGARNAALSEGRALAKWVLPWDGNCFVTAAAWREITEAVRAAPENPYFIVPMSRITDNAVLLDESARPPAREEPQILFRRDARLEFDPGYQYGRRPKVNLLWRLGVPGDWDGWAIEPWDHPCPPYAEQAGAFAEAGWVARLFSGRAEFENDDEESAVIVDRGQARVESIRGLLDRLDEQVGVTTVDCDRTCMIRLVEPAVANGVTIPGPLLDKLLATADDALKRGPYSVVDKLSLPPSGDRHDYWHPAPYYWPNRLRWRGMPYVFRDGHRVPGTRLYEPLSDNYDRTRLQRLFDDSFVLALAWHHTGDARYAEHAAGMVRSWFLDPETAMNPHLEYAQVRWGHNGNKGSGRGIIEMKDLYYFLDGVRLLERGAFLSSSEQNDLRRWLARYLDWLRTSEQGRGERAANNNHGTYYDLQVAAIATYLDEPGIIRETLRDSRSRMLSQFDSIGAQPEELKRTSTAHYCCFNLQGWLHLAMIAEVAGADLWSFQGHDSRGIRRGMEWLLSHAGQDWPYPQIDMFDAERFAPIGHVYASKFGKHWPATDDALASHVDIKPIFYPHDGIMPFWQIGRIVEVGQT